MTKSAKSRLASRKTSKSPSSTLMSTIANGGSSLRATRTASSGKSIGKLVDGMSEADRGRLRNRTDEEIQAGIDADPDAAPILDPKFWKNVRLVGPANKEPTSIRLDPDVLTWFRSFGKGYQTRINVVLRSYVEAQRKGGKRPRA
jgi:uncharacterized protein (DUF4415 family)